LLELVFDVFGDKEVLDNYQAAREEQKSAERELGELGIDLDRLKTQAEEKKAEANRFLEWKQLADEIHALEAEIVPRLEVAELERELADPAQREYTGVIIREADRLTALVDSMSGTARLPRKLRTNVHELCDHVFTLVRGEAPASVRLERDYDPSLPDANLDRDQVVQALLNLARNALQAIGERGRIVLRSRALAGVTIGTVRHRLVASLQVEDDGPGVPEELRGSLFFPLVSGRAGGTGLGLAVAQEIASRHGGLVEFDSAPGRTVFTLLLPIVEAA